MGRNHSHVSRRTVLKLTGGAVGSAELAGLATASDDVVLNVGFENDAGRTAALDAADHVEREFVFDAVTIRASTNAIEGLANDPNVRYVEEDGRMQTLDESYPWGIRRVDADVAHSHGYDGSGANVSIVGTGIDAFHPDLQENLGDGACFVSCSGWNCGPCWHDDNGHDTHVAGIVAAAKNGDGVIGVGHSSTLHAVKVLDGSGSGSYSDIATGIEWSADEGHDVINLSLGGGYSSVVHDACQHAYYNRGALIVAAAGNDGCYDCVNYPAAHDEVIAVSATDQNDNLASFSSTGPEIEFAAPGEFIYSTAPGGGHEPRSGTSMASPHVAGAAGQLMAQGYDNYDARSRLQNTAEDIGLSSAEQGHGLVDVASALGLD